MPQPQPHLRYLKPYTPGEQLDGRDVIKLNTNEFPYPPAPEVVEAIRKEAGDSVRRYPSSRCAPLCERLAERHGVSREEILVGNGSDEILRLLIQVYAGPGRTTASLDPTYSLYAPLSRIANGNYQAYNLDNLIGWPQDLPRDAWDLFLLCVPNPPLGTVFEYDNINNLANGSGLLVLDEAYIEFADNLPSRYTSLKKENVVRTRTFSKAWGLAGLRVGYAVGDPEVIARLSAVADSYNVNRISQAAALAALNARDYYEERVEQIKTDRAWLANELDDRGFKVHPGQGNFLFAEYRQAIILYRKLKERNILVRHLSAPRLEKGLRISIGTRKELSSLLDAVDQILPDLAL